MKQPLLACIDLLSTTEARYGVLQGRYCGCDETEDYSQAVMPTNGTISRLFAKAAAPGNGKSWAITLRVNGADTELTCTISDTATTANDTAHSVDVVAGDLVNIKVIPSGTPDCNARCTIYFSTQFTGNTSGESIQLGTSGGHVLGVATNYIGLQACNCLDLTTTEDDTRQLVAAPGTFKKLYVQLSEDPGTSPDAYQFTVRKNNDDTTLTCTITADDTSGNDTINSFVVAAGDTLDLEIAPIETPSATPHVGWGVVFVATTDGESLILSGSDDGLFLAGTQYNALAGDRKDWTSNELHALALCNACTLKSLYLKLSGDPGDGNSYAFTVRQNEGSSSLTCTVADTNTTANDTTNTVTISDGDTVAIMQVPDSLPTGRDAYWGVVAYIAPTPPAVIRLGNSIVLPSVGAIIPSTAGAEQKQIEGTNHSYYVLAFDKTTLEKADWQFLMPSSYDEGNVLVQIYWVADPIVGGVVFDVNFGHAGDSDSCDPVLTNQECAAVTVDGTTRDINISSCTLTTPFKAGEYAIIRIHRETGDGSDNMDGDAEIIGVSLQWV